MIKICDQCDDDEDDEEYDVDATNVEGNGGDASLFNHMQRWRWWPMAIIIIIMMAMMMARAIVIMMIKWIICESQQR